MNQVLRAHDVIDELAKVASDTDALALQRYFKTGPGEYGEGDIFIGVRVPTTRAICKRYAALPISELQLLLDSPIHEHRLAGLLIAVMQHKKASPTHKTALFNWYLYNLSNNRINNWDLIDTSSSYLLGEFIFDNPQDTLYTLARSSAIWERRAAIIATLANIKHRDTTATFSIALILLHDPEDLIHKAVGWMLRETGSRVDHALLLQFLDEHAATMPRTMLRYAIEKFNPVERAHYLGLRATIERFGS